MKLLSFSHQGKASWGALQGDRIVDLGSHFAGRYPDLRSLLSADAVEQARAAASSVPASLSQADIEWLPTIPNPDKILCIGVNYAERNAEYKDASDLPKYPSVFIRTPGSLVGHLQAVVRPPESPQLDYEGEITLVVGRAGRRIAEADAHLYIAGLTIMNEGTVRDWLRHGKFNVTQGKTWEASGSIGPWMVTSDEFAGFGDVTVTTRVNGEQRQHDTTANLMFPFRTLIRYISTWTALKPGDVIVTGTPIGAGIRFTPPKFLKPGDVVEVEVSGVGVLSNTVADEKP